LLDKSEKEIKLEQGKSSKVSFNIQMILPVLSSIEDKISERQEDSALQYPFLFACKN